MVMSNKMSLEQATEIVDEYIATCRCNECKAVRVIIVHHQQREKEAREAVQIFRSMDEPDAIEPAKKLFDAIAKEENEKLDGPGMFVTHSPTPQQQMESKCDNIPSGMYLWRKDKLIAQFTVVRDSSNWSVCVFTDLRSKYNGRTLEKFGGAE